MLANGSARPWTSAALALKVPAGWTARATTATAATRLAPGARLTAAWQVTPAPGRPGGHPWTLTAEGTATAPGGPVRYAAPAPPPPRPRRPPGTATSDLPWISAVNGWGPVERDASNGRNAAGDGTPISFGGTTYAKGLGVHAYSDVAFHLGGAADRFTTLVGIDDFSARQSSVGATRATVYGDDRVLHTTGVLTAATGPVPSTSTSGASGSCAWRSPTPTTRPPSTTPPGPWPGSRSSGDPAAAPFGSRHSSGGTQSTGTVDMWSSLCGVEPRRAPRIGLSLQLPTTMTRAVWRVAASIRAWAGFSSMTSTTVGTPARSASATACSRPVRPACRMAS